MELGTVLRYERTLPNGVIDTVTGFVFRQNRHVSPVHGPSVLVLEPCGVNSLVHLREAEVADALEMCPCVVKWTEESGPLDLFHVSHLVDRYTRRMAEEHGDNLPVPLWTAMCNLVQLYGYELDLTTEDVAVLMKYRLLAKEDEWWNSTHEIEKRLIKKEDPL